MLTHYSRRIGTIVPDRARGESEGNTERLPQRNGESVGRWKQATAIVRTLEHRVLGPPGREVLVHVAERREEL